MARLRTVDFFPFEGFPDRPWGSVPGSPGDLLADALLRAARPVVALYTEALAQVDVDGPRAELSIAITEARSPAGVAVDVWRREPLAGPERAFVTLSPAVGRLAATGRAELALAIVHAAVQELATARGWDPSRFEVCREHVVAQAHAYTWSGPWRSSPDRRHRARAGYTIDAPDGFGRARIEVGSRGQDGAVTSPAAVASCLASRFRHSAATLAWTGTDRVGLAPLVGHGPGTGAITGRAVGDGWSFEVRDDVDVRPPGGAGIEEGPRAGVPEVTASLA